MLLHPPTVTTSSVLDKNEAISSRRTGSSGEKVVSVVALVIATGVLVELVRPQFHGSPG